MKLKLVVVVIVCLSLFNIVFADAPKDSYLESDVYFGLSEDNGHIISNDEFKKFEDSVILQNFKDGFTIEDGHGEWLSDKIGVVQEPSKVLLVVYQDTPDNRNKIESIADQYKKQFNQESVLVVTKSVDVNFY